MRLEPTIAELDKKAEEYKTAADALRNLLKYEGAENAGNSTTSSATTKSVDDQKVKSTNSKSKTTGNGNSIGNGKKRTVSPETRAKIAAATKARHEAKRNQTGG